MIRSLRQLLKAYWKELTKAQIKQKKSRLLIYDEHLKRFVSADELLIPNETFKINKVGGPISKRKSKDLLYDLLLKKFVNTKLDIYSSGGMEDRSFSKLHGPWKNFEGISSYNRDLFWGKKYSRKKNRVPALPPVNGQPPTKEEKTTKTGWAGQRTINPETDPRPELRSSSDCSVGPGKRPDKKKPPRKKNDKKRLIVCAEKKHKITEKELINSSLTWKALPETETSARNTIHKPKDHVQHSNVSVIKSEACNKDNVTKSRVLLNGKDSELSVGSTNPCFGKTSEMVKARELHSEDESPENLKEQKCNKSICAQTKNANIECMKNNKQGAPDKQLNCETFGKIKDQAVKVSDRVNYEPIKTCAGKDVSGNSKICDKKTKEHQNSKTTLSSQISQKQTVLRKLPNITEFDSNYSKDVNKIIKLYKGILPKKTKPLPLQNDDVTKCVSRYNKEVSKSIMLYKGKSSDFELNCETKRKFKELSGKPSDKVIHESTNVCSSREKDNVLECSYKDENLQNNSTKCVSSCNKDVSKQFMLCKGDSPEIGLNFENKEHIKQQPCKTNDQVMPKDETTNICASSKEGTDFNVAIGECNRSFKNVTTEQQNIKVGQSCSNKNSPEQTILPDLPTVTKCSSSCNKDVNKSTTTELCNTSKVNKTLRQNTHQQAHSKYVPSKATKCYSNTQLNKDDNNSICSSVKSKCSQEIKKCQVVSPKKRCSPGEKEAKKTTSTCRSDSNVNFNSSTHPDGKVCEATKCSKANKTLSRPKCTSFPLTSSTIANSLDCKSTKDKPKPSRTYCPSQPDLSNSGTCSCKEDKKFSRTTLRKGLEFGLKRPRTEPTTTTCSADESNLNDKTKRTMIDNKQAGKKESREVDLNFCKDEKIQSKQSKGSISLPQSEKCSVSSSKSKTKKNKTKKFQSGKKKKGCKKDCKSGLKEKKLCNESTKEMSSKQEHNCNNITQMDNNSKPSTSREKQMVKRNKYKLQTINKLSSNMSSRHSKEILKKCKQSINVKSGTKENDNSSTSLSHKDTKYKESICKTKRLENGTEINLKKEDQLLKTNQSSSSCKNKPDKKDIPAKKQESRTTLKQTQSTMTAKICSQRCSRKTKSEMLLKPIQKNEDNKFIVDQSCKARSKGLSKTVTKIKSSTKCNICSNKNDSNPENKQIMQPGNSKPTNKDNMKNTLNSKALSSASHKLKEQEIRHFSAFKLHSEFKELAIKSNPKKIPTFNTTKSEISSYTNIRSSKENMEVNTTGLRKVLNQTNVKKSSSYEGERSLQKPSIHASVVTKKIVPPKNITIKPSCNTKEANVVSIEANTANHDMPESRENQFYSNFKKNPVFTKCISNSHNQKRKEDSKSATVKPSVSKNVANKNKSSTILYLGNSGATTLEKGYNNVGDKNQSGSKNYTISSSKKQTQTDENCHNHKGDILKKINSELPNGVKKIIRNKIYRDVGRSINSIDKKQSKRPLQYSEKYLTEDNASPEQVLVRPLEMLCTGVQDFGEKNVKINQKPKNLARRNPLIQKALPILTSENPSNKAIEKDILPKIDQKLKNLARRNPLIKKALSIVQCENPSNRAIEKDILPYISQVCSDGVSKAPQKSKKTETAPKKHPKVRCLLKNNVPFKDAHIIDNHLQTKIKQDSQNSNCHCPKAIKSTNVRDSTKRRKVCVLKKSNTYTVLSSKAEKDNDVTKIKALSSFVQKTKIVPKIKTFTVQASKIQKKNIPKSKTFTVIPRKSYKADKQRVMCTIQKSDV